MQRHAPALCRLLSWLESGFGSLHQNLRADLEHFGNTEERRHRHGSLAGHVTIQGGPLDANGFGEVFLIHSALNQLNFDLSGKCGFESFKRVHVH